MLEIPLTSLPSIRLFFKSCSDKDRTKGRVMMYRSVQRFDSSHGLLSPDRLFPKERDPNLFVTVVLKVSVADEPSSLREPSKGTNNTWAPTRPVFTVCPPDSCFTKVYTLGVSP